MRRLPLTAAALLTASLALAGCGGDDKDKKKEAEPTPSASATVAPEPILHPLTGAEISSTPDHPVMVVKVDNVAQAAPQDGIKPADMVVEELVEGGVTRLAAFYYSKLPDRVGPVRSMRTSDINIVTPARARIITSGAAAQTITALKEAGVQYFEEGQVKGFSRDTSRRAPHNLFASVQEIGAKLALPAKDPVPYFEFGDPAANPAGKPATGLTAHFGSRNTQWSWADGVWTNTNTFMAEDSQFAPTSIVALQAKVTSAGYGGYNGSFVPETHLLGTGKAWLFHNGTVVEGTWTKKTAGSTITLTQGAKKIVVPVGKTFVELVPEGEGGVTVS